MSKQIRLPSISFIVARSYPDNIIGYKNKLPWRLSADLRRFREITEYHVIIMGRNTHESIGNVLPNRENIVISRRKIEDRQNLYWAKDKETAVLMADVFSIIRGKKEFFVIGGEVIFHLFFEKQKGVDRIHETLVFGGDRIKGDAYFNIKIDKRIWKTKLEHEIPASDKDEFPSRYIIHENKRIVPRYQKSIEYFTGRDQLKKILDQYKYHNPSQEELVFEIFEQQNFPDFFTEEVEEAPAP